MRVTIHQPEHMPWLGFFHKVNMADVYVVLDNVQYRRRYFQNRNKIRTRNGWQWLTVPLTREHRDDLLIKDARVCNEDGAWKRKNLESIYHSYARAACFNQFWDEFRSVYDEAHESLCAFNLSLIRFILAAFGIGSDILLASTLGVSGQKGDLILDICRALRADTYISGISGRDYLDFAQFEQSKIAVIVQEFHHPIYSQAFEPFLPCMSAIDLLFNCGDKSLDMLNGIGVPVMEELFN